jgi:succinate dehydrogenase / fumarate reductase flavoprotein subunit
LEIGDIHDHEILIIGGGLSGLRAAFEASLSCDDVAIISKVHPLRSHSVAAQGGINAALGNADGAEDDSWLRHAYDTVYGSDYLADQDAVEILTGEASQAVIDLEHMGTVFSRLENGTIAQRPFGGAGFPRTCYAADRTGHNLLHTIYEQTQVTDIKFYEEFYVTSLISHKNRCVGAVALKIENGTLHGFRSKSLLLATGGYGRLFNRSTNALINMGDGAALALKAGCPLKDMEFIQFHPTTLYGTNILITEGARGEGGLLYNSDGKRFMMDYAPSSMELAPRDIVARAIQTEVDEGRGIDGEYVHLDLTGLGAEKIKERLPGIRQIAMDFAGVDPIIDPIPVQPGQHYSMGGIDCDKECRTPIPGLYTAGEAACVSVHGANRLGGNSLLETVVFGKIAGRVMAEDAKGKDHAEDVVVQGILKSEQKRLQSILEKKEGEPAYKIRDELKEVMFTHFGIFRNEDSMNEGLKKLNDIQNRFDSAYLGPVDTRFDFSLIHFLELESLITISTSVAMGAIMRRESRGSHSRPDHPKRDDKKFLSHSITYLKDGSCVLEYRPVTPGQFPLKERVY